MPRMKYTLEENSEGQQFWACTHENGTCENLPPGMPLQFNPREKKGDQSQLPTGSVVILQAGESQRSLEVAERVRAALATGGRLK